MTVGTTNYITGGTTAVPRIIEYDLARWKRSVRIKRQIFALHGVGRSDRVLVCHPFAPWSIGGIFSEAAMECGARVFPFGLLSHEPAFLDMIAKVSPSVICGAPNYVVALMEKIASRQDCPNSPHLIFFGGEKLTRKHLTSFKELAPSAECIDIYGMAEFDAVGVGTSSGEAGIALVNKFEFALKTDMGLSPLTLSAKGVLQIRESGAAWHSTDDLVTVVDFDAYLTSAEDSSLSGWIIQIHGRATACIVLSDGTVVLEAHIQRALDELNIYCAWQMKLRQRDDHQQKLVLAVDSPEVAQLREEILHQISRTNVDLVDSLRFGIVGGIEVEFTPSSSMKTTQRGKIIRMFSNQRGK